MCCIAARRVKCSASRASFSFHFFFFFFFSSLFSFLSYFSSSTLRFVPFAFCFLSLLFLFLFFFFTSARSANVFSLLFSLFPFFFSRLCRQTHEQHISASLGDRRDHDSRNDERPQRRMQTVSVRVFGRVSVTRLPSLYFCFHRGVGAA